MSFDQAKWVWMNGELTEWKDATIHVSSHALHYGSGVFEGIRCYETEEGPAVFRLDAHLERLFASAATHGLRIPYSRAELELAIDELIALNGFSSCYVRPICFFGSASLALHPRECPVETAVLAWPWSAYLGEESKLRGVRLTVSSWTKIDSRALPATAKACGQYLNSTLALREAVERGFDEALLLDARGNIAEGSGENLFLVRGGELWTNDEQSPILPGITRDSVITIARDLGLEVVVGPLRLGDLLASDEAFLTGTAAEVAPIREVDGTVIRGGQRGPVTERIQNVFFDAVRGRGSRYRQWLFFVGRSNLAGRNTEQSQRAQGSKD